MNKGKKLKIEEEFEKEIKFEKKAEEELEDKKYYQKTMIEQKQEFGKIDANESKNMPKRERVGRARDGKDTTRRRKHDSGI